MAASYTINGPVNIGSSSTETSIYGSISLNNTTTSEGDLVYSNALNTLTRLGIGSVGQILSNNGSIPVWASFSSFQQYDAVVSTSGAVGTYPLLSAAIADGKKNIYIQPGSYTEPAAITIPNGTMIIGEKAATTIITFSGLTTPGLYNDSLSGISQTSGTISISNGGTTVTGSGTTFTALSPGDFIFIIGVFYTIASITNDTTLIITEVYRGKTAASIPYAAYRLGAGFRIEDVTIRNSTITPSTSSGIFGKGIFRVFMKNLIVTGFVNNIVFDTVSTVYGELVMSRNSTGAGITVTNGYNSGFRLVACVNNNGIGMLIQGSSFNITLTAPICNNNSSHGLHIVGTSNVISIVGGILESNVTNGLDIGNGTSNVNISSSLSYRNTIGINYGGSQNSVTSCTITNNSSTGIVTGPNALITGNHIASNGGVGIDMANDDRITLTGNTVHDNGSHGISITGATQYSTITGNAVYNNGGRGISISGPGAGDNVVSANACRNNIQDGIYIASDTNVVTGNRCTGNSVGITVTNTASDNIVSVCNLKNNVTSLINNGIGTSLTGNLT